MEAGAGQVHALMKDVKAVDWLPLDEAVERLSHGYERAFLANVGPLALQAAALSRAAAPNVEPDIGRSDTTGAAQDRRISLAGKVREWLRRVI
jgi:8-oxo-dGTP diphosphatase